MFEPAHGIDLVGLLKAEFEMCKLKRGDLAAILSGRSAAVIAPPITTLRENLRAD